MTAYIKALFRRRSLQPHPKIPVSAIVKLLPVWVHIKRIHGWLILQLSNEEWAEKLIFGGSYHPVSTQFCWDKQLTIQHIQAVEGENGFGLSSSRKPWERFLWRCRCRRKLMGPLLLSFVIEDAKHWFSEWRPKKLVKKKASSGRNVSSWLS